MAKSDERLNLGCSLAMAPKGGIARKIQRQDMLEYLDHKITYQRGTLTTSSHSSNPHLQKYINPMQMVNPIAFGSYRHLVTLQHTTNEYLSRLTAKMCT